MTQNVDSRLLSGVYVLHSGIKAAIQARERGFTQQHLTQNLRFKDVTWGGTNQNPHYWAKNEGFWSFQGGVPSAGHGWRPTCMRTSQNGTPPVRRMGFVSWLSGLSIGI